MVLRETNLVGDNLVEDVVLERPAWRSMGTTHTGELLIHKRIGPIGIAVEMRSYAYQIGLYDL